MASQLWSKDHKQPTIYRDLFSNVSPELQKEFTSWDQQLNQFEWKHRFRHYSNEPIKCEWTAIRFGNMGNEHFEKREWRQAMEMYNQGLCFAENDSEYMGILFAKRGFCFCNMQMYAAGITDMDIALKLKLSPEWVAECRQISETFNQQTKAHEPLLPKLSYECDDDYPAMANVLELKFDGKKRTCIVAKVDIDVGKTVLLEESFTSIANGYSKTCCATCLHEIRNFIPCRMCTGAVFCSLKCYHLNRLHRDSCGEKFQRMPTPVKFVIQSILEAKSIFPTIDFWMQFVQLYIGSPNAMVAAAIFKVPLDAKMQNYGLFLKQKIQNAMPLVTVYQVYTTLLTMPSISKCFNTRGKKQFLMHLVGHHTMVLSCNAYGGFEVNQNQFISGTMANLVAMIEHSCTPNVAHFSYGSKEVCITIRPIRAGEHLCYDYWPDDDDDDVIDEDDIKGEDDHNDRAGAAEKRMKLRKQKIWECWRIDCKCSKCSMRTFGLALNPRMVTDPVFFFVSNYKKRFGNIQPTELLKQKCVHFLNEFKDAAWSKEMEVIVKAYSKCILDEYNRSYSPPLQVLQAHTQFKST